MDNSDGERYSLSDNGLILSCAIILGVILMFLIVKVAHNRKEKLRVVSQLVQSGADPIGVRCAMSSDSNMNECIIMSALAGSNKASENLGGAN